MYFTNLWSKQKENDCYFKSENSMFNVSRDNIPVIVAKQFYLVYNLSKVKKIVLVGLACICTQINIPILLI